jgi:hypothetical protein
MNELTQLMTAARFASATAGWVVGIKAGAALLFVFFLAVFDVATACFPPISFVYAICYHNP